MNARGDSWFREGTVKNTLLGAVLALGGWSGIELIGLMGRVSVSESREQAHDQQVTSLFAAQSEVRKDLSDIQVAIARMEGKLDVLNQKIDDGRGQPYANTQEKHR